ncbi:MAG: thiamine pyrophosphate-binding protein, partial [Thermoanaerobaculia bacterium]
MNGGAIIAEVLARHGIDTLFTLCGGHISPILVEAKRRGLRVIDTRHEATAVFAADAYARLKGVPGVAAVTAGPGVTNATTALRNALLAASPLVLLGGATATVLRGRGALQDIDQITAVRPHVKEVFPVRRLRELAPVLTRAFASARSGVPGPVFVQCPVDLLYDESIVREWYGAASRRGRRSIAASLQARWLAWHTNRLFAGGAGEIPGPIEIGRAEPTRAALAAVARAIAGSRRPLILAGSSTTGEPAKAGETAEAIRKLGIPVFLSGMARGLLGERDPLQMKHHRKKALAAADLVILAGVPADFRLDYGRQIGRNAKVIAVGRERKDLTLNLRPSQAIETDPGMFFRMLSRMVGAEHRPEWIDLLEGAERSREEEIVAQSADDDGGINPIALCRALDGVLSDRAVLVADGGD